MKKCWICGKELEVNAKEIVIWKPYRMKIPKKTGRWYCDKCLKEEERQHEETKAIYASLKMRLMYERAIRTLEDNVEDIEPYKEIILDMKSYVEENPEKFDSSSEIVAALMLVANGIQAKMQYKVLSYRVDFLLPQLRIVLEVDGDRHLGMKAELRDSKRDKAIRAELGEEWEVIRVPVDVLEENPEKLLEAIITAKQERQRLRAKNNGELPYNYSRTCS